MPDESPQRRRRPRGRRRGGQERPQQAPAEPQRPRGAGGRGRPARDDRRVATRESAAPRRGRRGGRGRGPRGPEDIRPGTPCVILLDSREGEPDRTGATAVFEGFFDFETGEPRRPGAGIPRLRVGDERLWGFECWWRPDADRAGLTDADREDLETAKRLLRGLLRDARRSTRPLAAR